MYHWVDRSRLGRSAVPLVALLVLIGLTAAGCFHESSNVANGGSPMSASFDLPQTASAGASFEAQLNVTVHRSFPAVSVVTQINGFNLVDKGDFMSAERSTLRGVMIQPSAGSSQTFGFQLSCPGRGTFTLTAVISTKGHDPVVAEGQVECEGLGSSTDG